MLGLDDFHNLLENCIVALIVLPKASSHLSVVYTMLQALSLIIQEASSVVLLPQLQVGNKCGRVSCAALRANFMVLDGRAWTAFAHKVAVPEVVVQSISPCFWTSCTCSSLSASS